MCLWSCTALAAAEVPVLTFEQKVNIVVQAQKNPAVLSVKLEQKDAEVSIAIIADKNTDRSQAETIANDVVLLTKSLSLDDKPVDEKNLGKGLYDYRVTINRVDGILLLSASKPAKKKKLSLDPPAQIQAPVQVRPWTRADETAR